MLGERRARGLPVPCDDVDDAGRESDLLRELAEVEGREGRLFRRFEDHCAAGCERRRELRHGHQQWRIPRHDEPRDADGLAHGIGVMRSRIRDREGLAGDLRRPTGEVSQSLDRSPHIE